MLVTPIKFEMLWIHNLREIKEKSEYCQINLEAKLFAFLYWVRNRALTPRDTVHSCAQKINSDVNRGSTK